VSNNEARLLKGNKLIDELLESRRKDAGDDLHDTVLKRDGVKTIRSDHLRVLGEERNKSLVDEERWAPPLWNSVTKLRRSSFTMGQKALKNVGPKPLGPGCRRASTIGLSSIPPQKKEARERTTQRYAAVAQQG
jgi:hypothetical protein